jgi:hypothetical protein
MCRKLAVELPDCDGLRDEAVRATTNGSKDERARIAQEIWQRESRLPFWQGAKFRILVGLTNDDGPLDGYESEYLVEFADLSGVPCDRIMSAFGVANVRYPQKRTGRLPPLADVALYGYVGASSGRLALSVTATVTIGAVVIITLLTVDYLFHRLMLRAFERLIDRLPPYRLNGRYRSQSEPDKYALLPKPRNGSQPPDADIRDRARLGAARKRSSVPTLALDR